MEVTLEVKEDSLQFFLDIVKNFRFVKVKAVAAKTQKQKIMSLAGSWNGMSELDFDEYLTKAKETELFAKETSL